MGSYYYSPHQNQNEIFFILALLCLCFVGLIVYIFSDVSSGDESDENSLASNLDKLGGITSMNEPDLAGGFDLEKVLSDLKNSEMPKKETPIAAVLEPKQSEYTTKHISEDSEKNPHRKRKKKSKPIINSEEKPALKKESETYKFKPIVVTEKTTQQEDKKYQNTESPIKHFVVRDKKNAEEYEKKKKLFE